MTVNVTTITSFYDNFYLVVCVVCVWLRFVCVVCVCGVVWCVCLFFVWLGCVVVCFFHRVFFFLLNVFTNFQKFFKFSKVFNLVKTFKNY